MEQSPYTDSGDLAIPEANNSRIDRRKHDIVEQGLQVQQSSNTMSAIEYLRALDVDPQVIRRVLLEPNRRRGGI
jgi:hypothetical protein